MEEEKIVPKIGDIYYQYYEGKGLIKFEITNIKEGNLYPIRFKALDHPEFDYTFETMVSEWSLKENYSRDEIDAYRQYYQELGEKLKGYKKIVDDIKNERNAIYETIQSMISLELIRNGCFFRFDNLNFFEMCADKAREDAKDTIKNYMHSFQEVTKSFSPTNDTQEEFDTLVKEISEKVVKEEKIISHEYIMRYGRL